jgi:hypothetical protein
MSLLAPREWDDDGFDDEDLDCTWCGGDGLTECDDPLGCPGPHIGGWGGYCECRPCSGTGLRSKQTVW